MIKRTYTHIFDLDFTIGQDLYTFVNWMYKNDQNPSHKVVLIRQNFLLGFLSLGRIA